MSLRRRLLLLLPAALCCLAPMQDCLAQKLAKVDPFVVQPQNYAVIDMSGTSTNGKIVEEMAFDDSNNAAFAYWDGPAHKVGLWHSGALVESAKETGSQITLTLSTKGSPGTVAPYTAGTLSSSNGMAFDQLAGASAGPPLISLPAYAYALFALNINGELAASAVVSDEDGQNHNLTVFWPYGTKTANCIQTQSFPDTTFLGLTTVTCLRPDGTLLGGGGYQGPYAQRGDYAYKAVGLGQMSAGSATPTATLGCQPVVTPNCYEEDTYITTAASMSGVTGASRYDQKSDSSEGGPVTSSLKALYIGGQLLEQDTSSPPRNGDTPVSPLKLGDIAAVNDQSDVVVTGTYYAGLYYKTLAGSKQFFLQNDSSPGLIPPLAQPHLRNIYPFLMSNRVTPSGSGVQPVVNILISAEIERSPAIWQYSIFLLRLLSDGTTDLHELVYPAGVTEVALLHINSSGVIAAIANPGAGYGHAVLLVPVQLTNKADPTIKNGANGKDTIIQFLQSSTDTNIGAVAWIAGNDPNGTPVGAPRMPHPASADWRDQWTSRGKYLLETSSCIPRSVREPASRFRHGRRAERGCSRRYRNHPHRGVSI